MVVAVVVAVVAVVAVVVAAVVVAVVAAVAAVTAAAPPPHPSQLQPHLQTQTPIPGISQDPRAALKYIKFKTIQGVVSICSAGAPSTTLF